MSGGIDMKRVVFAGGGHAHLYSLRRTASFARRGHEVVLVNPSPYLYYSGMATGIISGNYASDENRIDVRRLVEGGGGRFIEGTVSRILHENRELLLESGQRVSYDAASFCLGSETRQSLAFTGGDSIPVKPVSNTKDVRARVLGFEGNANGPRVLIVGGGAAGCEVAANTARLMEDSASGGSVTLTEAGPSLLSASPKKARREVLNHLMRQGVEVLLNTAVASSEDGSVRTGNGRLLEADLIVLSTGIVPSPVFRSSSLATGDDGGLWVDHCLRSVSDPRLFGGGDSISFRGQNLPSLGVFAVRQAPVLFHNLHAALRGEPLRMFNPQRRYLYILNLGDGTGLAIHGSLVWRGRSALMLKHLLDTRFMGRYG